MSLLSNFPLQTMRERQKNVLQEIESAIKSGYRHIFLEAPTGFGKSPLAIALALYSGSSHICTATKDLQTQYSKDFPFVREVKGRGNFPCIVKEEMGLDETCDYGPCVQGDDYDCLYKTRLLDYNVKGEGTTSELVTLDSLAKRKYLDKAKSRSKLVQVDWKPCHYYHQKWIGYRSSHTIYNYRYFLADVFYSGTLQKRKLLVLDEAHKLESEVSDFKSFTISKRSLRFLPKLQIPDRKEDDIETWIEFCLQLREKLLLFIDEASGYIERKRSFEPFSEKNLIDAISRENTLSAVIDDMQSDKGNWIVTNVEHDSSNQVQKATLTPLETASYFGDILDKGSLCFFMSATILSKDYLCKTAGLAADDVKFIQVQQSNFPVKNRPIFLMDVAWLNAKTMNDSLPKIAHAVNNIMTIHKNDKGIIHTTSYSQLHYIKDHLSKENATRLIETGSNFDRSEILQKHYSSSKPTVLISPSLHLGVDLKDDLSRFQVIVKVPYPDLTDRKISAMKQKDPKWYTWNTVLRLVQSYGRSVRSKDDFATTYILDSSISYLLKSAHDIIPKWFSEAIAQKA